MERVYPVIRKSACLCLPFFSHMVVDHYLSGLARSEPVVYWHRQVLAPISDCFDQNWVYAYAVAITSPSSRKKTACAEPLDPDHGILAHQRGCCSSSRTNAGIDESTTASASMRMHPCRSSTARPLDEKQPSAQRSLESGQAVENCRFDQSLLMSRSRRILQLGEKAVLQ